MRVDKTKAIYLRKQGKSYHEISEVLLIPKSTLSEWFKNLAWSQKIKNDLSYKNSVSQIGRLAQYSRIRAKNSAEKRALIQKVAAEEIKNISLKDIKLIGAALYWAEGAKTQNSRLLFVNSDSRMIKIIMRFFREILEIPQEKLRVSVQIHPNVSETIAKKYWSRITRIPLKKFYKTSYQISGASKGKRNKRSLPYGTCRINIGGTGYFHKIMGWIQGIAG